MNRDELRARYADILEDANDDAALARLLSALDTSYRAAEPPASLTAHPVWRARTSTRHVSPSTVSAHGWRRIFERVTPRLARPTDYASTESVTSGSKQSRRRAVLELAAIVLVVALVVGGVALWHAPEPPAKVSQGVTTASTDTPVPLLLLTASPNSGNKLLLHSIDPSSLADIPGRQPLEVVNGVITAFSPDNRMLALCSGAAAGGTVETLQLIDLSTWTVTRTLHVDQGTPWVVFSNDGRQLYWLGAEPRADHLSVMRYNVSSGALGSLNHMPTSFMPAGVKLVDQGSKLAVFGVQIDAKTSAAQGTPHLYLFDLATGAQRADLALPLAKAGSLPSTAADPNADLGHTYTPGLAWDTQRNLLYVVHADADRITEIDLEKARIVRDAAIRKPVSLLDRLGRWLMPRATALQAIPTTIRVASLSPDGSVLYIVNRQFGLTDSPNGNAALGTLGDAEIISTSDFSEIGTIPGHVESLAVSPDGHAIAVGLQNKAVHSSLVPDNYTLALYDAADLQEIAHLVSSDLTHVVGFSVDSRYAYVEDGNAVKVFDLSAQRFVASRAITGGAPPSGLLGPTIAPAYGGF